MVDVGSKHFRKVVDANLDCGGKGSCKVLSGTKGAPFTFSLPHWVLELAYNC